MYTTLSQFISQSFSDIAMFLPRLVAAIVIFLVGIALASALRKLVVKILDKVRFSAALKNTPVEHFVQNAELGQRVEDVLGSILYWLVMLVVAQTSVSVMGLTSLSVLLERILGYLPHVFSAVLVLFIGVLISGLVESLVKGTLKSLDAKSARALGKVASYSVVTLVALIALSELGIAQEFIFILFVGFVSTLSLGLGLALGLGGKDLVGKLLKSWHADITSKK
ncbi:MAG: hypothetical protein COY80_00420 [Candidatus Pacebacteria bacterium CG_4_10_14_0_8_um_filter_42_14]|nr:MAG: hypothetical protein COY80_00420 [Candidatus Pacebacteria bacterium CG_4_10_14_0_8_um_filter_42_14]